MFGIAGGLEPKGGLIQISSVSLPAARVNRPTMRNTPVPAIADHIEHVAKVAGYDHVGIGGDLDGIDTTVTGLDSVDDYPNLFAELIRRGWSDENLARLAGGNVLRILRRAEAVAASMKNEPAALSPVDEAPAQ